MAVTLAQAQLLAPNDFERLVVEQFQRSSYLLQRMPFDQAVSPAGGPALGYVYNRTASVPTAAFRAVNSDYTPTTETFEQKTTNLKPLGKSFVIDRLFRNTANVVTSQVNQAVQGVVNKWQDTAINGDSGADANSFDGLSKQLTGTATELTSAQNWTAVNSQATAFVAMQELDNMLATIPQGADVIFANLAAIGYLRTMARFASQAQQTQDAFGNLILTYAGIPVVNLGFKPGSTSLPIIPTTTGRTDIYAARLNDVDGFHGVTMENGSPINIILPDFSRVESTQTGAVELVSSVVLKSTYGAAVLRGVQVGPTS